MATTTIIWVGAAAAVTWESSSESLSVTPSVRRRGSWRQHCVQTQVNGGSPRRRYILLYQTIHICPKKIFYSHLSLLLPGKLMKLGVLCTYVSINYSWSHLLPDAAIIKRNYYYDVVWYPSRSNICRFVSWWSKFSLATIPLSDALN